MRNTGDVSKTDIAKGVISVSWPFLSIIAVLVELSFFSMSTLSAARAFVGGESLWSKGQKEAVQQLSLYVQSGAVQHYAQFKAAIAVPRGDMLARQILQQRNPDLELVRAGFLQGGNDAQDIPGVIRLFQRFHSYGPIAHAITIWQQGDAQINQLVRLGQEIHMALQQGDRREASAKLSQVLRIDALLTPLETTFSIALGAASRQAERLLQVSTGLLALLLVAAGLARTRQVVWSERRMAAALRRNERRQQAALTASDYGIFDIDLERGVAHLSAHFMAALGYPDWPDQVAMAEVAQVIHPDDRSLFARRVHDDDGPENDFGRYAEYRLLCASGEVRWARVEAGATRDSIGHRVRLAGTMRDITEPRLIKEKLFEQTERALVTLDSISEAVITTDAQGRIDYMNEHAEHLLDVRCDEARGVAVASVCRFIDEASRQMLSHPVEQALLNGSTVASPPTAALVKRGGTEISIDASASLMHAQNHSVFGAVLVLRDVRQDRIAASQMKHQATHDVLTGLINRREFESLVEAAVKARDDRAPHAVFYLDLDRFKIVNDSCGHEAGDLLLREISNVMKSALRESDFLARLGGDEFAILLRGCSGHDAAVVAEKIRDVVSAHRFFFRGRTFSVSASIGVVALDTTFAGYADVIRGADAACYHAKEHGGDRITFFHPSDADLASRQAAIRWPPIIKDALDENRFCLYAQRIERTCPGPLDPVRFEVLLRLDAGEGNLVSPQAFLPSAERYHLASAIDRWVISAVFDALGKRREKVSESCSINLSGASIGDPRMIEHILSASETAGVDPRRICFEVTETAVISNIGAAQHSISRLREEGFHFALDDFGAGMASFGYLKHLHVDYMKIDGSFVRQMLVEHTDRAMVQSIQQIARAFGIQTVAEFVESRAIREALAEVGVDYVQGFCVHKPQPLDEVLAQRV